VLTIRLLGEIEIVRDGAVLTLPPSRKTRALLAYMIASERPHRRERLCSLFWEIPDDPRGALRWSLSRLRSLVNERGNERIVADRETVGFQAMGADIDLARLRERAKDIASLATDELVEAAGWFRGEFLEGVDLPDLFDFQAWCLAEREDVRRLQSRLLTAIAERLNAAPERALPHVRQLVQIDPYNAAARSTLLRHLVALGRKSEAEQHFETGARVLEEVGGGAEISLLRTWRELHRPSRPAVTPALGVPALAPSFVANLPETPAGIASRESDLPVIGRNVEIDRLVKVLSRATETGRPQIALVTADPGLGKTRIAEEIVHVAEERGIATWSGRAYEIERSRPYAMWTAAIGDLPEPTIEFGDERAPAGEAVERARERMFAAVADRIFGDTAPEAPILIVFDDVHWCDEASGDLLHFFIRTAAGKPVTVLLMARQGELPDNTAMQRVLRTLRHDRMLEEIVLPPLGLAEAEALVRAVAPEADASRIAAESGGNPLFAIELGRSLRDRSDDVPVSLEELVRDRVDRLPARAADIIRWATVLGPSFMAERLAVLVNLDIGELTDLLETVERHALVRADTEGANIGYQFSHDLIHRAIYTALSEPRRRLMHRKIAAMLRDEGGGVDTLAEEIAHHAVLGGDHGMAAKACVEAGRHSLRLYANAEAVAFARRGIRHAELLPQPERLMRTIEAVEIEVYANRPREIEPLVERLEALAESALDHNCLEHARMVFQLLSFLRWERGMWRDAEHDTLRAELVSRTADDGQRVTAMAETARCLAMLERDLDQAEALLLEGTALARRLDIEPNAIPDATGMLRFHQGKVDEAATAFRRARVLAQRDAERTSEFFALEHLVELELSRGACGEAAHIAHDLVRLAEKLSTGSEGPFARALVAFCRLASDDADADAELSAALVDLVNADAKRRLALCLRFAAKVDLDQGRVDRAWLRADESLRLAKLLDRPSDIALARIVLIEAADRRKDRAAYDEHVAALRRDLARPVSSHARTLAQSLCSADRPSPAKLVVMKASAA
jgi:DNA-binding SARP family transcriptional activator